MCLVDDDDIGRRIYSDIPAQRLKGDELDGNRGAVCGVAPHLAERCRRRDQYARIPGRDGKRDESLPEPRLIREQRTATVGDRQLDASHGALLVRAQDDFAELCGAYGLNGFAERGRSDRGAHLIQRRHQISRGLTSAARIR